jgi:threonine synthase
LFHGPTFAFKDVALQMLGNFFEYFLETGSNGGRLAVLGATSGDTGSAAIAGLRGKHGVDCIILYPHNRVSAIQEQQMITITDENIHCVAVENATFDDCQDIVKRSFDTPAFRDKVCLGAVNSINWCRVLVQTTYYFWSYLRVLDYLSPSAANGSSSNSDAMSSAAASVSAFEVHFSVPTGNFGDILAGYYAKRMGVPVGKLIVATNENDILYRFFTTGCYHRENIQPTISPSMDIAVSSNFERYLYHLASDDSPTLCSWMNEFEATKKLTLSGDLLRKAQQDFDAARADTALTLKVIEEYSSKFNYVLCPHSAVGVSAIKQLSLIAPHTVCLATAHHGKFPDAVARGLGGTDKLPPPPEQLAVLATLPTRRNILPNNVDAVQEFVEQSVEKTRRRTQWNSAWTMVKHVMAHAVVVAVVALTIQKISASSARARR